MKQNKNKLKRNEIKRNDNNNNNKNKCCDNTALNYINDAQTLES